MSEAKGRELSYAKRWQNFHGWRNKKKGFWPFYWTFRYGKCEYDVLQWTRRCPRAHVNDNVERQEAIVCCRWKRIIAPRLFLSLFWNTFRANRLRLRQLFWSVLCSHCLRKIDPIYYTPRHTKTSATIHGSKKSHVHKKEESQELFF